MTMNDLGRFVRTYAENVSALEVIQSLGARNIKNPDSEWIIHSCLIDRFDPHHKNGDANPSAAINRKTKRYSCFGYGSMSFEDFLTIAFGNDNDKKIAFMRGMSWEKRDTLLDRLKQKLAPEVAQDKNEPISELVFTGMSNVCPYMRDVRKVSQDVLDRHGIRFDDTMNSVVIPLYEYENDGKILVGFQRRNLTKGKPKYVNSDNLHKQSLLYYGSGARESSEIILVESIMSVLRLETLGITNAVATLGSVVHDEQLSQLRRHRSIIIWFDDDLAGVKGTKDFIRKTSGRFKIDVVFSDRRHADPADMDLEEVRRNLSQSMPLLKAIPFVNKAEKVLREHERARA